MPRGMADNAEKHRSTFAASNAVSASPVLVPGSGRARSMKSRLNIGPQGVYQRIISKSKHSAISTVKWVQGDSLVRIAFVAGRRLELPMQVQLRRPSPTMFAAGCDRCSGVRHSSKTVTCSATLKRRSPFVNRNTFYSIADGNMRGDRLALVDCNFVGRSLTGRGLLTSR